MYIMYCTVLYCTVYHVLGDKVYKVMVSVTVYTGFVKGSETIFFNVHCWEKGERTERSWRTATDPPKPRASPDRSPRESSIEHK
jgi:hypothetical protein